MIERDRISKKIIVQQHTERTMHTPQGKVAHAVSICDKSTEENVEDSCVYSKDKEVENEREDAKVKTLRFSANR
jgi:hypothetical protein